MIIIVDGIDRVGKTTLCNMLSEALNYPVGKDDSRYAKTYDDMLINAEKDNTFVNLIEQGCLDNVIFDRFHFTEYVYGVIDRGYYNLYMQDIDERLGELNNIFLILVKPTNIDKSSREHGKSLLRHSEMFYKLYKNTKIKNKMIVDYNMFSETVSYIKRREKECQDQKS